MAMKAMNAIAVADDLVEFLKDHPGYLARVHSVFPHAANLLVGDDELITLTNQQDITPMGLMVDCIVSFAEFLKAGEKVVLDIDHFRAARGVFAVNMRDAEVWETGSTMSQDARSLEEVAQIRLKLLRWLGQQPAQGLLPLLPRLTHQSINSRPVVDNLYSRHIAADLEEFTKAINTPDWEHALALADRLIGFGMGSTPSCDDFLAAYLVVLKIAESLHPGRFVWVRQFNNAIASKAKGQTTLISANMLRHAADGKISRSHQRLILTCLFNNNGKLEHLASQVMQHGATSGGDFLLGLICALEWVQKAMTDISKEGEQAWVELKLKQPVPSI